MQMQIFVFAALRNIITLSSTEMGAKEKQGMKFIITFTTLIKLSTLPSVLNMAISNRVAHSYLDVKHQGAV